MPDTQLDQLSVEEPPSTFGFSINPWIVIVIALAVLVIWYLFGSKLRFWSKPETPPSDTIDPVQLQMLQMQAMMQQQQLQQPPTPKQPQHSQQSHKPKHQQKPSRNSTQRVRIVETIDAESETSDDEADDEKIPIVLGSSRIPFTGFPVDLGSLVEIAINSEKLAPSKANIEELESVDDDTQKDPKEDSDEEEEQPAPKVKVNKPRKRKSSTNKNQEESP